MYNAGITAHVILHTVSLPNLPMFYSTPFFVGQEIVFHATQTCEQQTNTFSQTKQASKVL